MKEKQCSQCGRTGIKHLATHLQECPIVHNQEPNTELLRSEEQLRQEYWGKGKSLREIASENNTSRQTVRRAMIDFGIERRAENGKGDTHAEV